MSWPVGWLGSSEATSVLDQMTADFAVIDAAIAGDAAEIEGAALRECCIDAAVIVCDGETDTWECPWCGRTWEAPCR